VINREGTEAVMIAPLDIETSAHRAGEHRWIEQRLFEILGRWSAEITVPEAKGLLGAQSYHHAWHAELWRGCLPTLPHLDPDGATAAPSLGLAAVFDDVADGAGDHDALERLVGVYRLVVPRLAAAYARRQTEASVVTDGPVLRALELIGPDLARDGDAGERLVQSLVRTAADARRAAERQGWLEGQLIEAGGIT
jgi:hypothetical protein